MSWIIPSSLTNRSNRIYDEFLEKCRDDAINKSIPILDETDTKYFPYSEENLPIPRIIEEPKKQRSKRNHVKDENVVEYINAMSKEHQQISQKQVIVFVPKRKKKKIN